MSLITTPAPAAVTAPVTPEAGTALDVPPPPVQTQSLNSVAAEVADAPANKAKECSGTQGYSTIDFIRTYALNKSSTQL